MTNNPKDCSQTGVWPDMQARIAGESPCLPPFGEKLVACNYAFLAVCVPNRRFVQWIEQHWLRASKLARWEMVLALDPSYGTHDTGEILTRIYALQESSEGRLSARLLTPGKLGDAAPRLSMAILCNENEPVLASVGSSPAFGLGVPAAGDVNLWLSLSVSQTNDIRQLARAYWESAAKLTKYRCDVPLLDPCKGNEEGYIHWHAFEAMLNDPSDAFAEPGPSIRELPLTPEGKLDEEAIPANQDATLSGLVDHMPKAPPIVSDVQALYERGALVSVQHNVKPMSVPIPASLFGQQAEQQVGAVKHTQQFRIALFADEATAKDVEKQRTRVTELVKVFSYSFGNGKYWVPSTARAALNAAIDKADKSSQSGLSAAYGGDLDKFLEQRRPAIKQDLENIYKRFYPNSAMPSDSLDKVMNLLRERVTGATKDGLAPKITSTAIAFRYSTDAREDPWSDATLLLSKIAIRSRELVTDRYKPRELKIADISVPDYLRVMNVMGDALVDLALEKGWESPWVADRARKEVDVLEANAASDDSNESRCQWLIDLIKGREQGSG
jgi:hypothetical protein